MECKTILYGIEFITYTLMLFFALKTPGFWYVAVIVSYTLCKLEKLT